MKKLKRLFIAISILCLLCGIFFSFVLPIYHSVNFPDNMFVTTEDISSINNNSGYSPFVKFSLSNSITANNEEITYTTMDIKLFGWLPLKKVKVKLLNYSKVIMGGNTLGFFLNSDGMIVVGSNPIYTANGSIEPIKNSEIKHGDIIKKVNGYEIENIEDVTLALNDSNVSDIATIEIERDGEILDISLTPALDLFTQKYRLGLWVKNSASAVGTLTYIKPKDKRFGAVGHPISFSEFDKTGSAVTGNVYLCDYIGIKKGEKNKPGELCTTLRMSDKSIGYADTNCDYGIYGNITDSQNITNNTLTNLGGRLSVEMGDAKIYCDIDGEGIKGYSIKIIKASHQEKANDKSIMFKVTDKDLIAKTGGIVQGMSGSPIIQNNKLIGAVTHVFLNDPTKAFGVYIDWMIDN